MDTAVVIPVDITCWGCWGCVGCGLCGFTPAAISGASCLSGLNI